MDNAKYLEQTRAQIQNLRNFQQFITTAQENLYKCSEHRERAQEAYSCDEFERANKHLDQAGEHLNTAQQKIDAAKKEEKLSREAEDIEVEANKLRNDIALEQEKINSLHYKSQWLLELDDAIQDAEADQNWELCRRYALDALDIKPDSTKFIAYSKRVENIKGKTSANKIRWL
jgi:hypothetical protein